MNWKQWAAFLGLMVLVGTLGVGYTTTQSVTNTTKNAGGTPLETGWAYIDSADTYASAAYLGNCSGRIYAVIKAEGYSTTGDSVNTAYGDSLDYRVQAKWFRDDSWVAVDSLLYWDASDSSVLVRYWPGKGPTGSGLFPGRWMRLYVGQQGLSSSVGDSNWVGFDTTRVRFMIDCEEK
jgi:hypothetical protein